MRKLVSRLLDIFTVRHCVMCGKAVPLRCQLSICPGCEDKVARYGQTITTAGKASVSVLPYTGATRRAMGRFKFANKKYYGHTFGWLIYTRLNEIEVCNNVQCVACVPMKGRNRLYNQSAVIAEYVAERLNVPFVENALVKIKNNEPFYKLGIRERQKLVKGAYDVEDVSFAGKKVLLIDDIYTTGTTLGECRNILLRNGATEVVCATVCYAIAKEIIKSE